MPNFSKSECIAQNIVFVDGLWRSGKAILGPVLRCYERVEKQRLEHIYEYLCVMHRHGKIDTDAAMTLMRMFSDIAMYNMMISREVNLRFFDESGLFNNPNCLTYLTRLFHDDGDSVMERIKRDRPILQLMTHMMFPGVDLVFKAFGSRAKVIEMVRHPLYMVEGWDNYIDRCGTDPREFTLWLEHDGRCLPWFANGWENKYVSSSRIDKVIYSMKWLFDQMDNAGKGLNDEQRKQVLIIPFEKFVVGPYPFLDRIESFLGTKLTPAIAKTLKKQKCPRKYISAGRGHDRWGGNPPDIDDIEDYNRRIEFVRANASNEAYTVLKELSLQYETKYGLSDQSPWNRLVRNH
ncbi:MAG: hypothetical protein HYS21_03675 [Deltaproteobacteria bacterium]|nr:hypothetical protein [Deltaproteobacteria bacterium]